MESEASGRRARAGPAAEDEPAPAPDAAGKKTRALWPTRAPLAALVLTAVLLVAISILSALLVWQSYGETVRAAEARARSASETVSAHIHWIGEAAFQALRRIDESLGARPDLFTVTTVGDLDDAVASLPEQVTAWVFDAEGDLILTNDGAGGMLNVADRDYFQALRDGDEWHISKLLSALRTDRKIFTIGRRIERDGRFIGAAVILVPAQLMAQFWANLDLGPDSSVGLIRDDGWLVARFPVPEEAIDLSDYVLFTDYLRKEPAGFYHAASPADGVGRIVGYTRVSGFPLVAIAGISRDAAVARFWSRIGRAALVAAPIALALLGVVGWVAVLLRRYERQRQELSEALDQNRMLFREIHHRVKNNLQTVSSLIQMHSLSPEAREEIAGRIGAMTAIHEHIYSSDQYGRLGLGGYVRRLVENLKESNAGPVEVRCDLEEIEVEAERALPLGLIINEVATNAFKHAFPDGREGHIDVTLRERGGRAVLTISDDGVGTGGTEAAGGMGSRLVRGLSRQIDADYRFEGGEGTTFVLEFPV